MECNPSSSGHRQRFGQTPPLGQLEEVVDGADDGPLGVHFFEAAQQELAETARACLICPNTVSGSCLRSR
jgi:hypothetical protein